jgi:hypothetical protein
MHLHFLATEGGVDEAGVFHKIPRIDDSRLAEIFAREVLAMLVRKELLSPEWAERILSWRHTGFNVHSLVRTKTKPEAERVGKYMLRPVLALERLTFLEPDGKVDPMLCPKCGGRMKVIAFLTDFSVVDRIIGHLKLTFVVERPPPPHVFEQVALPAALMEAMRTARLPLRPVLKETSLRLHECGPRERGIFLGFDDQEGVGVYHLSAGARRFSV